ncbi:MAG: ParB/RepB/Spo0J family partition protein [Clostridia bacterium]|nr:ParB/RepB/Spo0J family partition protein [Clostridia bacterium]
MTLPAHKDHITSRQVCWLPMDKILPRPEGTFADARPALFLSELTASILQYGLLQPITVREGTEGRYEILSGNRRYLACRMAGFSHIDAVVLPAAAQGSSLCRLLEDLMCQQLHFFEEARAFETLITAYGLTQEELARQLNRSPSAIANKLRLLKLEPVLRAFILEEGLTERHARALLRLPNAQGRLRIARKAAAQNLSVRDTELLVDSALARLPVPPPPDRKVIALVRDHRLYLNALQGIVSQMQEAGLDACWDLKSHGNRLKVTIDLPIRKGKFG